jgi:hypothetical protein
VRLKPLVRRGAVLGLAIVLASGLAHPAPADQGRSGPAEIRRSYRSRAAPAALGAARRESRRPSVSPAEADPAALEPVPAGTGFEAITGDKGNAPADPIGAAGEAHVLTAVNVHFAIYEKTNGNEVLGPLRLRSLFPRVPFPFDPKVVYDHYRDTFVLVYLGARFGGRRPRSWINVVSMPESTVEQPSTWCRRKLKGDQVRRSGNLWADYPGLGFDRERVYVTTNQFTFDSEEFRYAQILALRKAGLYDCDRRLVKTVFARGQTRDPQGTPAFTIQPAVTETDTGATPPEFLVSFQDTECAFTCGRRLTVWRIEERPRGGLDLARRAVGVGRAFVAPFGTQKGGGNDCTGAQDLKLCWDTGDLRLTSAFYDADRGFLYAAHAIGADVGGSSDPEAAIRWYEVDPVPLAASTATRREVFGQANRFAGWPAVGTDAAGNLFVTYSRATSFGPGEYLSVWVASIAPGTTQAEQESIEEGNDTYVDPQSRGPQRWGDFNGLSRDPVDPSVVWSVNQVADDGDSVPDEVTDVWQQWVHPLQAAP